ncbi:hypothetical protein IDJ77_01710 [Mucilaginibacter sp. ZT4R22]|uniref:Uncharacterized protein n=1 Tax=Mucilaginibacter pankratovii TaxID=2772110 RepID=A0ABR7WJM0_9SPHI|nr:hypothetical protein [Mucilaginibacter pankratovii]MBD1362513.1 hypothetical protein [Mucilaginibacter pankratovii]
MSFDYGDEREHFAEGFHIIPTTRHLWVAGNDSALEVIVSYSVMEAMAFLTINRVRYPKPEQLLFIAIGIRLHTEQSTWIRQRLRKRKFTLVFGSDLIGHITDIKFTAAIKNLPIRIAHEKHQVLIYCQEQSRSFEDEYISLHQFRLAYGIRANIRTRKPTQSSSFLEQLKQDALIK